MTTRAMGAVMVLVIAPIGIATWILATYTIGESLEPQSAVLIGLGVALLAISTAASLILLGNACEPLGSHLGRILILCGTTCVLIALALQFYLAGMVAQNFQHVTDLLRERGGGVNLNANFPKSVEAIAYLAFLAGLWLAAIGIRIGLSGNGQPVAAPSPSSVKPEISA